MAFTNNPYCTLQQVKNALNLTGTTDDAWIQEELIPQAQQEVDEYCGRTWQTDGTTGTPATRTYNGINHSRLIIDDCQSISQVTEQYQVTFQGADGIWVVGGTTIIDITADVVLGPYNFATYNGAGHYLIRKSHIEFDYGIQNYVVKGVFGNPNIPSDITRACTRLAVHWYKQRDTNYADSMSETGGIRMKYAKRIPDDVVEILERRRRRFFLARSVS
jgi:hypothetical protein